MLYCLKAALTVSLCCKIWSEEKEEVKDEHINILFKALSRLDLKTSQNQVFGPPSCGPRGSHGSHRTTQKRVRDLKISVVVGGEAVNIRAVLGIQLYYYSKSLGYGNSLEVQWCGHYHSSFGTFKKKLTIRKYLKRFISCISCISNYYYLGCYRKLLHESTPLFPSY